MEGTINLYHNNINLKIDIITNIINILYESKNMSVFDNTITNIKNIYNSNCILIIIQSSKNETNELKNKYVQLLENINVINNINNLYNNIKSTFVNEFEKNLNIKHLSRQFDNIKIKITFIKNDINKCFLCGSDTIIIPEKSLLQCSNSECSRITTVAINDMNFQNNEMKQVNIKPKRHKSNEHCALWINRILAQEYENIPNHIITKLIEKARLEYTVNGVLKKMDNMKCSLIRRWLKEIKESKYYNNAPLIRKLVTGYFGKAIIPPQLSEIEKYELIHEYENCIKYFSEINNDKTLLKEIGKTEIKYKSYYPDILYRLINIKLQFDQRKSRILECIKLQNEKTLIKNDKIWNKIYKLSIDNECVINNNT